MVATSRKVEIRNGKIALPEDMLEQSGIGTSNGVVIVDLKESGEIIVRARQDDTGTVVRTVWPTMPEPDIDHGSSEYQLWLVQSSAGVLHEYLDDILTPPILSDEELPAYWRRLAEEAIADEVIRSMVESEHDDDVH